MNDPLNNSRLCYTRSRKSSEVPPDACSRGNQEKVKTKQSLLSAATFPSNRSGRSNPWKLPEQKTQKKEMRIRDNSFTRVPADV
jgi:hypothetical protein